MINASGVIPVCCGEAMSPIPANTVDASHEKHIPDVSVEKIDVGTRLSVKVGSVLHPMTDAHYIQWVFVETEKGGQRHAFKPGDAPETTFIVDKDDKPVAVYAYCNLHGLWKASL